MRIGFIVLTAILVLACSDGQASTRSTPEGPSAAIDSVLSPQESMARLVSGLANPEALSGGAPEADSLIKRLLAALGSRDANALRNLMVNRAEYGYLYYPTSEYAKEPYDLPASTAWTLSSQGSAKGAGRLLDRLGGRQLSWRSHECGKTSVEGRNRIHSQCLTTFADEDGETVTIRLFQSIIEREGTLKFLSLAGDF